MATKRVETTTIVEGDGDELDPQGGDPGGRSPIEEDILRSLVELGSATDGVRWQVKRLSPVDRAGYVATYESGELTLERLQDDCGGGKYNIRGMDAGGKYVGAKTITIQDKPRSLQAPIAAVPPPTPSNDFGPLAHVLTAMQANADRQMQMMMGLLTAVIGKPAPQGPDPLAMIAAMKDIFKPEAKEESAVMMLLKGLEMGRDIGGGGGETDFMSLIGKGIDAVKPLIGKGLEHAAKNAQALHPVPGNGQLPPVATNPLATLPVPQNPPPPTIKPIATGEQNEMMKILAWLQKQVAALTQQAMKKKDPGLYAEVFLDNIPPFVPMELLKEQLTADNAIERLIALHPAVADHKEWFAQFREACIQILTEGPEEPGTNQGEAQAPLDNE